VLALSISSPSSMPDQSFSLSSCVFCTSVLPAGSVCVVEDTLGLWAAVVCVYIDQISLKWDLRGLGWLYAKLDATAFWVSDDFNVFNLFNSKSKEALCVLKSVWYRYFPPL
jgi:hypothetical protein